MDHRFVFCFLFSPYGKTKKFWLKKFVCVFDGISSGHFLDNCHAENDQVRSKISQ